MQRIRAILLCAILVGLPLVGFSAEATASAHAEEGIPTSAVEITRIGPLPITNSMIVIWAVAIGLIIFAQVATRNMKEIPSGAQNFWEWLVEGLYSFLEGIIGHTLVKKTFWFFATIFIFILFSNWIGLIPGFGTIGFGEKGPHGFHVTHPWFRG